MSDIIPPHSPDAEKGALSCVIQEPSKFKDLIRAGAIRRWFYVSAHQEIFHTLSSAGQPCDAVMLRSRLKDRGKFDEVGGDQYLSEILDASPSPENLAYYIPELVDKFQRRGLLQFSAKIEAAAMDPTADSANHLADVENTWRTIRSNADESLPEIEDAAELAVKEIEEPKELVYGLLHRGSKFVIGGCSKSFKTWTLG